MTRNEKLAKDIQKFLNEHNLQSDTRIYYDGLAISNGEEILEDLTPSDFFEYANDETVSMSFEGPLNFLLNYSSDYALMEEFNKVFRNHGAWFEQGYAWSLSTYFNKDYM